MRKHKKKAIKIMTEFVEGRMSIQDFKYQWDNNPIIIKTFANYPNRPYKMNCGYDYIGYISSFDINKRGDALNFHGFIREFLELNGYPCTPTDYYDKRYEFILKIQPNWLDIYDEDFLEKQIISQIPEGLSEPKTIAWCKARIKELFRYDDKPPRWVQGAEWPIKNGKPLVFRNQVRVKGDDYRVLYYFYDPETGEEEIVEQFT